MVLRSTKILTCDTSRWMLMWSNVELNKPFPPKPKKMLGRPRKKRSRAAHEGASSTRISKVGVSRGVVSRGVIRGGNTCGSRALPRWFGVGACTHPVTGETFTGSRNSIPLPIWPNGVPLPSASAIARGSQTSASIQVPMSSQLQNEYAHASHVQK
nr:hypothetical protein [Tanacetum cinerariifolium]